MTNPDAIKEISAIESLFDTAYQRLAVLKKALMEGGNSTAPNRDNSFDDKLEEVLKQRRSNRIKKSH